MYSKLHKSDYEIAKGNMCHHAQFSSTCKRNTEPALLNWLACNMEPEEVKKGLKESRGYGHILNKSWVVTM